MAKYGARLIWRGVTWHIPLGEHRLWEGRKGGGHSLTLLALLLLLLLVLLLLLLLLVVVVQGVRVQHLLVRIEVQHLLLLVVGLGGKLWVQQLGMLPEVVLQWILLLLLLLLWLWRRADLEGRQHRVLLWLLLLLLNFFLLLWLSLLLRAHTAGRGTGTCPLTLAAPAAHATDGTS